MSSLAFSLLIIFLYFWNKSDAEYSLNLILYQISSSSLKFYFNWNYFGGLKAIKS